MTRKAPAPLLWVVLTTLPLVSLAASINDAFNAGKAFGSEASATMAGPTMAAEDVPGFATATPAEVQLYGNAAGLEDAAATAASNNEAAQSVTEGFVERPYFTIDPETDPMIKKEGQIAGNAQSIAGAIQGEYSDCQPAVVETPHPPTLEVCYENRGAQRHTCNDRLTITVEFPTGTTTRDGPWTSMSGDCNADTWSDTQAVGCPSGYYAPQPIEIRRQSKWRTGDAWGGDTGWQPFTSAWNARTYVNCANNQCTYRTRGVISWGNDYCAGNQWYTRMALRVRCQKAPVVRDQWDGGCAALEARVK